MLYIWDGLSAILKSLFWNVDDSVVQLIISLQTFLFEADLFIKIF